MQNILLVIDMQNDFVDGVLGTPEAQAIVPRLRDYVEGYNGRVIYTRDTHFENYLDTTEGKALPVPHCIKGTRGHEICDALRDVRTWEILDKFTFGSLDLVECLRHAEYDGKIKRLVLVGVCTDICVISNALILKAAYPDADVVVMSELCAGTTPEKHASALEVMRSCQIKVI